MTLISLDQVCYAPEGTPVLRDISLRTDQRRVGIVGRNGSGKTSLARVMAGLIPVTSGSVQIAGVDVANDRKSALGTVGILFQNPDHQIIFPTVEEELAFGLRQMGDTEGQAASKVATLLDRFGKSHWPKAPIVQLSQGQRQLVCLMAVLAMGPKVIILDEPFAGLDIPTTIQLQALLRGLDQTIVLITHHPENLNDFDRVVWIEQGAVAADGTPADVIPDFNDTMTKLGGGHDLSDLSG